MSSVVTSFQIASVFNLDDEKGQVSYVDISTVDFQQHIDKIIYQYVDAANKREFEPNETAPVISALQRLAVESITEELESFKTVFYSETKLIAERLVQIQRKVTERSPSINSPKKGSLVIVVSHQGDEIHILLSKIDQEIYLDLDDYEYTLGLPKENSTQKTCNITYKISDDELEVKDIFVSDSNSKIATFWYKDFLELEEMHDDAKNTKYAFRQINTFIRSKVKKKAPNYYTIMRNNLTGYFATNQAFKIEDLAEYVVGDIPLEDSNIDVVSLKRDLIKLPAKKRFDSSFNIRKDAIENRLLKKTYKINDKIELRTFGFLGNLKDTIIAREDKFGNNILEIRNIDQETFESFKFDSEDKNDNLEE
jgi:hypothetical protein